ncbi:hypothetical protein FQA39_LY03762 [Lamprigera yunnana]|nr:hypothetical protein FQA39_LY03762 [Lamprigera yunnana]
MPSTSTALPANSEREFISLLIELYRDCPELCKVKSTDYFNRNKKSAALEEIVRALKVLQADYNVKQLKQKINVLRTNFNREFKAIEEKKVSGTFTNDIPAPSPWYYKDINFIKDQLEIAQTETSEQPIHDEDSQSQLNSSSVAYPSDVVSPSTPKQDAPGKARPATEYFKRPETKEDNLAKGWALKLKKLLPAQRRFTEKIINDKLFEAEMGNLRRDGVRFQMSNPHWSTSPPSSSCSSINSWQGYPNSAQASYTSRPSERHSYPERDHKTSNEEDADTFFSPFTSMFL